MKKKRVAFRIFSGNRLTMPLLLNIWEKAGLDRQFDIVLVDGEPGRLTAGETRTLLGSDACIYSFMTPHLPLVAGEVRALRAAGKKPPLLVAGGPHVSGEQDAALAGGFDVLCRGAGAAWEEYIPVSGYFRTVPPLEISRGCFWKCRYCQTGATRPLTRGEGSIRRYLDELRRRGLPRVGFISPSALEFGARRRGRPELDRIEGLMELCLRAGFRFTEFGIFPSEIRPDTVSAESLNLLRRHVANRRLTFGAQSASTASLASLGRGHDTAAIWQAVEIANSAGFSANLDFIIALPGETAAARRELLEFMAALRRKHRVHIQLHHFFPLAGSAFSRRLPSFLSAEERRVFSALKKNGLASDWWLEGERTARAYLSWLEHDFPEFFSGFC